MSKPATMPGAMNPGLMIEGRPEIMGPEAAEAAGIAPEVVAATEGVTPESAADTAAQTEGKNGGILDKLRGSRLGTALAVGGSAIAMAGAAEGVSASQADAYAGDPSIVETTKHRTVVGVGGSKLSVEAFGKSSSRSKVEIVANARSISRREVRKAIRSGEADCDRMSPKEAIRKGVVTQGYDGSGKGFAPENRKSTICKIDGKLYRIECGNRAKITHKPRPQKAKETVWVKSFAKAKAFVKDVAFTKVKGYCKTANTYVEGTAWGRGVAGARLKIRDIVKAKGNRVKKLIVRKRNLAQLRASANASAKLDLSCNEEGGKPVPPTEVPPEQHKDPSNTQQPPANAPGTNPAPSPEEPYPGGYQCYDEITGAPEEPRPDGTCKPGDVGSF